MKKFSCAHIVIIITASCILIPILLILIWSFAGRWPWPELLPESYSLRTIKELFSGSNPLPQLLASSVLLASAAAFIATVIGIMTARAIELYNFRGKTLLRLCTLLPLIVPGTVLAMGLQLVFLRLGLADTVTGVILIHVISALPYCITIMADITRATGIRYEEQALVLGAGPWRAFFTVSLPVLAPGILSSVSMAFILSYSQYFSTLIIGGGKVKTLTLVLVPYIQSGDRPLMSVYSIVFIFSALLIFFILEVLVLRSRKEAL